MTTTITAATGRAVSGVIGAVDTDTTDRRRIARAGLVLPNHPIPLMAVRALSGRGHKGARLVGRVDRVTLDGLLIHGEGVALDGLEAELPAGEYGCDLDLDAVRTSLAGTDGRAVTEAYIGDVLAGLEDLRQVATAARVIGVTVYLPGSTAAPAFPAARLAVA